MGIAVSLINKYKQVKKRRCKFLKIKLPALINRTRFQNTIRWVVPLCGDYTKICEDHLFLNQQSTEYTYICMDLFLSEVLKFQIIQLEIVDTILLYTVL